MNFPELLPYLNILLIPAVGYIMSQDRKAVRLETKMDALTEALRAHTEREERLLELLAKR